MRFFVSQISSFIATASYHLENIYRIPLRAKEIYCNIEYLQFFNYR